MNKFAKLFETEEHGQLLVIMDMSEPSVSVKFDPMIDGMWTISIDIGSKNEDYDKIQEIFESLTEDSVIGTIVPVKAKIQQQFAESDEN